MNLQTALLKIERLEEVVVRLIAFLPESLGKDNAEMLLEQLAEPLPVEPDLTTKNTTDG